MTGQVYHNKHKNLAGTRRRFIVIVTSERGRLSTFAQLFKELLICVYWGLKTMLFLLQNC